MDRFDGVALRDVQLSDDVGVAVDAAGDVIQWGIGFDQLHPEPRKTIIGLDLLRVQICSSKIYALSRSGHVYVFAAEHEKQLRKEAASTSPSSSTPLSWFSSPYEYVKLKAGEKFADIAAGEHHVLALSRAGYVYSVPVDEHANEYGQLGYSRVALAHQCEPTKLVDARLEPEVIRKARRSDTVGSSSHVSTDAIASSDIRYATQLRPVPSLEGICFAQIAAGTHHSVVRTPDGRVLTWGHNANGQLGLGAHVTFNTVAVPSEVSWPVSIVGRHAVCTRIAAGGSNTFFVVRSRDAPIHPDDKGSKPSVRIDVLAVGGGQRGTLGSGQRSQACGVPMRVKNLSGLYEYSEREKCLSPIDVHSLSVGSSGQCALVMEAPSLDQAETRRDVYVWGNNDSSQLGSGGKGHTAVPALMMHMPSSTKTTGLTGKSTKTESEGTETEEETPPEPEDLPQRLLLVERSNVRGRAWDGKERTFSNAEQQIVAGGASMTIFTKVQA